MQTNYNSAPTLRKKGEEYRDAKGMAGKAIRSHSLEYCIAKGLGERDFAAYKVMMFFTAQAFDVYSPALKTVCERCCISERGYKNARKKLCDMGWITLVGGKSITVNYDEIYKVLDTREENEAEAEKDKSITQCTECTPIKNQKITQCTECTPKQCTECTPSKCTEFTHNNINNTINNNIISGLGISAEAETPAVPREKEAGEKQSKVLVAPHGVILTDEDGNFSF